MSWPWSIPITGHLLLATGSWLFSPRGEVGDLASLWTDYPSGCVSRTGFILLCRPCNDGNLKRHCEVLEWNGNGRSNLSGYWLLFFNGFEYITGCWQLNTILSAWPRRIVALLVLCLASWFLRVSLLVTATATDHSLHAGYLLTSLLSCSFKSGSSSCMICQIISTLIPK